MRNTLAVALRTRRGLTLFAVAAVVCLVFAGDALAQTEPDPPPGAFPDWDDKADPPDNALELQDVVVLQKGYHYKIKDRQSGETFVHYYIETENTEAVLALFTAASEGRIGTRVEYSEMPCPYYYDPATGKMLRARPERASRRMQSRLPVPRLDRQLRPPGRLSRVLRERPHVLSLCPGLQRGGHGFLDDGRASSCPR